MPARVDRLALERPRSLKAALSMLAGDPKLTPIAGCTDVYVGLHFGSVKEQRFIDLWSLDELRGIGLDGGRLRIGALTTYTEIIRSKLATRRLPMLAAAAREVGARRPESSHARLQHCQRVACVRHGRPHGPAPSCSCVVYSANAGTLESFYTGIAPSSVNRTTDRAVDFPVVEGRQCAVKWGRGAAGHLEI